MRKISTCIVLSPRTYELMKLNGLNLSEFVENALQEMIVGTKADDLRRELNEVNVKHAGLMAGIAQLEAAEEKERTSGKVGSVLWSQLQASYWETFKAHDGFIDEREWSTRPRIVGYLKELKKPKTAVLLELREWADKKVYSDEEKGQW